ncbi:LVIVD repeat-containing protein [Nonomuraea sp. NPDC050663]|uniref:LVIVD repeat-containing protein n=1 Tax=Nonomuraea sp. NPDC050663 TaxID=3364370 RepID=UPI0037B15535
MRRGLLCLLLVLTACTAEPPRGAATYGGTPRATGSSGTTIEASALREYDESATSGGHLKPVTSLARQAPLDVEEAIGSDLAFTGTHAIAGNYLGFTVYDIARPEQPRVVSQVVCPGPQNDVTVSGHLLFLSVDLPVPDESCQNSGQYTPGGWEGVRIFDIADKAAPRYVGAVATPCGSHTATLIPSPTPEKVYLFATSSPSMTGSSECEAAHGMIVVVEVPVNDPASARIAASPTILEGGASKIANEDLKVGGCHDVTVHAPTRLAAASCIGDGVLLDVSDPLKPRVLDRVQDPQHFGYWHSAVFSADGDTIVFSDEFGGGQSIVCDPKTGGVWGANGVYGVSAERKLSFRGYFKIPRAVLAPLTCSAHNGSLVPVTGRDVMVQGWYEGGVSLIDFTDPARPQEIGFHQRGGAPYRDPGMSGGSWSAYFYNGYVYSSDMFKGLDVLRVEGLPLDGATLTEFNPQTQP